MKIEIKPQKNMSWFSFRKKTYGYNKLFFTKNLL